ncbi:hypothetical protein HPB49_011656 [Dermacentor silvarum]|uniref:Uncharacterized protein n=1 Tax=Dermacentor silvarum TaxID=543639 RepID=A0ACB8C3D4_DERSI|nr:hypothetical protein HPB49_011656 [Dermacentor silvarum]
MHRLRRFSARSREIISDPCNTAFIGRRKFPGARGHHFFSRWAPAISSWSNLAGDASTAARPNGGAPAPGESWHTTPATGDRVAGQQAGMWYYDPDAMLWTTVSTPDNGEPAPPSNFKSTALAAAVARRTRDRVLTAAVADAASLGAPTTSVCHDKPPPHASRAAGNKWKHSVAWKSLPLPKPPPEDFVVVVKPKTRVSFSEAFQEHGLGRSFIAYLGPTSAQVITMLPVMEQNIILVYTSKPEITDKIIGDFNLNWADGRVPLTGHLQQDGGNVYDTALLPYATRIRRRLSAPVSSGGKATYWRSASSGRLTKPG